MLPASFWFSPWNQTALSQILSPHLRSGGAGRLWPAPGSHDAWGVLRVPPLPGRWPLATWDARPLVPGDQGLSFRNSQDSQPHAAAVSFMMFPFSLQRGGQRRPQEGVQVPSSQRHRGHFSCLGGVVQLVGTGRRRRHPMPSSHQGAPSAPVSLPPSRGVRGPGCRADSLHPLSRAEH